MTKKGVFCPSYQAGKELRLKYLGRVGKDLRSQCQVTFVNRPKLGCWRDIYYSSYTNTFLNSLPIEPLR
jgi:hypothetical protein